MLTEVEHSFAGIDSQAFTVHRNISIIFLKKGLEEPQTPEVLFDAAIHRAQPYCALYEPYPAPQLGEQIANVWLLSSGAQGVFLLPIERAGINILTEDGINPEIFSYLEAKKDEERRQAAFWD